MTGRFSSPEQNLFQGRNLAANGVPLSTASFKLNLEQSSFVKTDDPEITLDM